MRFRYKATMDDMMMVTKVGITAGGSKVLLVPPSSRVF